jgi:probable phosphoglycerate mutase
VSDVTRLVLVRHGESQAAVDGVVAGRRGCSGLSEQGRAQAAALRDRLARTGELTADALLSSTLPRAVETAEIIAPALAVPEIVPDDDLCELRPGESDGMTWGEYDERYGVDMRADPFAPIAPGGESLAQFNLRVDRVLARLGQEHEGSSVVVACHGGVVVGSLVSFLGLPLQKPPPVDVAVTNASITEWERRDGHWKLVRFNDAAHLSAC